jgi:hypothetical protein
MTDEIERKRGIITPKDREFLLGESDIEPNSQSERNKRFRIRERMANALRDFQYLRQLEQGDLNQIVSQFDEDELDELIEDIAWFVAYFDMYDRFRDDYTERLQAMFNEEIINDDGTSVRY